jgi:hypothetical protein
MLGRFPLAGIEALMTASTTVDPQTQLKAAVRLARQYRHYRECNCCLYRRTKLLHGVMVHEGGFCSLEEARWSERIDLLIREITGH